MSEPQYDVCFDDVPVELGPMTGWTWRQNPRRLGMMLARYKFVAKMLEGYQHVAEIGCGDGFGSAVVREAVKRLWLYDFDDRFAEASGCWRLDITKQAIKRACDGIYMLDVLEHISPADEPAAMRNIVASLKPEGVFIAGCPSLESQKYASPLSLAGHVNCKTGNKLRDDAKRYFRNVFLFGMNDEVLHTGFAPMCHYLFIVCTGPNHSAE